jgi:hypothetical protein
VSVRSRAQVVERREIILSPIANACANIASKNRELTELISAIAAEPLDSKTVDIGPLTMQLSGVVDAAVNGGLLKYREAFFEGTYMTEFPTHRRFLRPFSLVRVPVSECVCVRLPNGSHAIIEGGIWSSCICCPCWIGARLCALFLVYHFSVRVLFSPQISALRTILYALGRHFPPPKKQPPIPPK